MCLAALRKNVPRRHFRALPVDDETPGDARVSVFRRTGVPPVEVAEPEVEDLRLDIFVVRGMDGFSQFLDQELDELGAPAAGSSGRPRASWAPVTWLSCSAMSSIEALG